MITFAQFRQLPAALFALLSGSALLLFAGGGCGGNGSAVSPPNDVARSALEGALNTWRDGGKPDALAGKEPAIQVNDTPWSQGQSLASYEILKEDTTGAQKLFTVRLSFKKPERVEEVQYYVLGQGPVMVFRDEDYRRNVNMEDGPKLSKPGTKKAPTRR
jgi:hypothetical protein